MCAPDYFGVDYVINPWMEGQKDKVDHALAVRQWGQLRDQIAARADVAFMPPAQGLPDEVFTANAGFVLKNRVVVSRFHAPERQGEEPLFNHWFKEAGFDIAPWPDDVFFEGAGDALCDRGTARIWCGYGFRSDILAVKLLEQTYERTAVGLRLVDPRFYHLDTCFCPLSDGYVMYFPPAFDAASQERIKAAIPLEKRITIGEADALGFACNAVELNKHLFINNPSIELQTRLHDRGFTAVVTPLSEFMKAGGAAKCLTLKLIED